MLIAPNPYDQHANNAAAWRSVSASEIEDRSNTTGRSNCIGAVVWEAKICPSRPPLINPIRLASRCSVRSRYRSRFPRSNAT